MKTDTTLKQASHLLKLVDDQNTPREQLEAIYDSGLFSILLKANIAEIDKEKFCEVCGLKRLIVKNQHGHYIITVIGLNLTGAEEEARHKNLGGEVGVYAHQVLTSTRPNSYDAKHRLEAGREYRIAVVPGKLVSKNRTTRTIQSYGASFGYQNVLAGHIPRVREAISNKQMEEEMGGIWYIAGLHDPIKDSDGGPEVLCSFRDGGVPRLGASRGDPEDEWSGSGAFAFVVPQVGA
jgi:hypothetical protein